MINEDSNDSGEFKSLQPEALRDMFDEDAKELFPQSFSLRDDEGLGTSCSKKPDFSMGAYFKGRSSYPGVNDDSAMRYSHLLDLPEQDTPSSQRSFRNAKFNEKENQKVRTLSIASDSFVASGSSSKHSGASPPVDANSSASSIKSLEQFFNDPDNSPMSSSAIMDHVLNYCKIRQEKTSGTAPEISRKNRQEESFNDLGRRLTDQHRKRESETYNAPSHSSLPKKKSTAPEIGQSFRDSNSFVDLGRRFTNESWKRESETYNAPSHSLSLPKTKTKAPEIEHKIRDSHSFVDLGRRYTQDGWKREASTYSTFTSDLSKKKHTSRCSTPDNVIVTTPSSSFSGSEKQQTCFVKPRAVSSASSARTMEQGYSQLTTMNAKRSDLYQGPETSRHTQPLQESNMRTPQAPSIQLQLNIPQTNMPQSMHGPMVINIICPPGNSQSSANAMLNSRPGSQDVLSRETNQQVQSQNSDNGPRPQIAIQFSGTFQWS